MPTRRPAALLVLLLAALPPAALAWQTALPDAPLASRPFDVAVDAAGDVVVVGRAIVTDSDDDGVLGKLAGGDGTLLWQRAVTGSAAGADLLRAVATDALRAIVAGGQVVNTGTAGDLLVVRYDAAGVQLWRREIDGGASGEDDALEVAVDADGSALVVGQMTPAGATASRFTLLKLAASDGATTWQKEVTDQSGTGRELILDGSDLYAGGDAGGKIVVAKHAAGDGAQAWRAELTGSADGAHLGRALAVGGGRVVVAGHVTSATRGQNFAVIALDAATGQESWRYTLDGTASGNADTDTAFDVAVDPAGDVVAAGSLGNTGSDDDGVLVKLAGGTGAELWRVVVSGSTNNDDVVEAIALDGGDVFVTGTIRDGRNRGGDVLLARFAGTTGAQSWRLTLGGTLNDGGFEIATAGGDVVVGTRLRIGAAAGSIAVLRRTGPNGGDFPCANGDVDEGEACDDGNVTPGDGCRANCTVEVCGDGIPDPQEGCDDGNVVTGDCCSPTCAAVDGGPCNDDNACTSGDVCSQGVCVAGSAVVCEPTDPCDRASCDPADGVCAHVRASEGSPCDDGSVCTILDQCIADTCTGSGAPTCRDSDPCTADACVAPVGCTFSAVTGFPALTCLFERTTIGSGCPAGVPRAIATRLDRARKQATTAGTTDRAPRVRRALNAARKALKQARRSADSGRRRGTLGEPCATALATALADMLSTTEGLRASLVAP